ncbi:Gfa-like protein [Minicystis rosea]|nr:Gfa-like protein [Minicystis rosea]
MAVPKAELHVTGETKCFAVAGGSGKAAIRHFCPHCGSLLFGTPEIAPQMVTLYTGSLDEADAFAPSYAQFTRSRPAWCGAVLPEHEASPHRR